MFIPKYRKKVIGYIKGKSAIYIARRHAERKRNFAGADKHYKLAFLTTGKLQLCQLVQTCRQFVRSGNNLSAIPSGVAHR